MFLRSTGTEPEELNTSFDLEHRRLVYYGSPSYVAMFVFCGLIGAYTFRFIVYPKCVKFHHYITKKRVTATLDQYDNIEFEEMMEQTAPRIDPETGELFMGTPKEKLTETQAMQQMLRDIKDAEKAEFDAQHKDDDVILGPDGKPLLADFAVDPYGNLISAEAGGLANGSSEETKEGEDAAAAAPAASASDSLKMKKKRKKATAEPKKMSPKKMALIENKRKENEEFRKAYAQSQKIPKLEDRIHVVKEEFEKYMLFGKEPLGYQLKLETTKRLERDVGKEKFALMPPSNYFHKLVEKEWVETEREKHRKVKFDKRRPQSAGGGLGLGLGYGEGRNSMGFEGQRKGPPIKDDGKSPTGADSRDKSVRTRGFGELPTRKDSPAQRERAGRTRNVMGRDLGTAREYFSRDGSGRPATQEEKKAMIEDEERRNAATSRSPSPHARSPSPDGRGQDGGGNNTSRTGPSQSPPRTKARPMTASQFRRAMYQ